jgi:hypothetical protein
MPERSDLEGAGEKVRVRETLAAAEAASRAADEGFWDDRRPRDFALIERLYGRALVLYIEVHGPAHPMVAWMLDRLGYVCHAQGLLDEAETYYLRSLSAWKQSGTPMSARVELTMLNLAVVYDVTGRDRLGEAILSHYDPTWKRAGR